MKKLKKPVKGSWVRMNSFGQLFKISIFGTSHGDSIGILIDGVPAGLKLDKDDFLISKWLLDRNEDLFTEYMGHSHGGDTTGDGNHRHQIKFNIQDKLEVNDKVILLRIDDKFIILDKVVSI